MPHAAISLRAVAWDKLMCSPATRKPEVGRATWLKKAETNYRRLREGSANKGILGWTQKMLHDDQLRFYSLATSRHRVGRGGQDSFLPLRLPSQPHHSCRLSLPHAHQSFKPLIISSSHHLMQQASPTALVSPKLNIENYIRGACLNQTAPVVR
jgi:hypothetical protein